MNPFSAIIRKLSGLEEAEKKAELVKQRNERVLAPLRQKANQRLLQQKRTGSIPTNNLVGRGAGILKPEILQKTAYQSRLQEILDAKPDRSMIQLPNGVYVNPQSQNNLSSFANAAATQVAYNNPLSPKAWANWYNSGREAIGTWTGNEGMRDAGTRGLAERRALESFNNAQAMDQRANFAGNAFGGVVNAATPLPIPTQKGVGFNISNAPSSSRVVNSLNSLPGRLATSGGRYGATTAADTGFGIREAGGSETAQKVGSAATGVTATLMGAFGLGRLGQPNAGSMTGQGVKQLLKNVAVSGNAEGMEELVEGGVDDLVARTTYDKNRSLAQTAQNLLTSYGVGAVSGGVLGGANARYGGEGGNTIAKQDLSAVNDNVNAGRVTEIRIDAQNQVNEMGSRADDAQARSTDKNLTPAQRKSARIEAKELYRQRDAKKIELEKLKKKEKRLRGGGLSLMSVDENGDPLPISGKKPQLDQSLDQDNKTASLDNSNPLESLKQEARISDKYIQEYADILKSQEEGTTGGQMIPDGDGGYKRYTEHSKFYREYYKKNKRKPSNRAWLEFAKKEAYENPDFVKYAQEQMEQDAQAESLEQQGSQFNKEGELRDVLDTPKPFNTFTEIAEGRAKVSNQAKKATQEAPDFLKPQESPQNPTNQSQQKERQSKQLPANQTSNQKTSSKENTPSNKPIIPPIANSEFTNQESSRRADVFDAVAASSKSNSGKKLVEGLKESSVLTKAAKQAENSGKELNFIAKKGEGDRYVDIVPVDMKSNRIEAGFVVDSNGNVIGNHVKVDNSGIQVNLGGEMVNMEAIIGNPTLWGNNYKVTENLNRNIDRNAPDKQTALRTKKWLWTNKVKSESNYRTELETEYSKLGDRIKTVESARPSNVSKTQFKEDIFAVLNGDKTDAQIKKTYSQESAKAILDYKKETRKLYDSLLKRVNAERVKFGQSEIEGRKDYITHLSELNNNKSFVGEVYSNIRNSFVDDGMQKTRDGIPTTIAGKSQDFKPVSAFNKFLQRRTGTESQRDPFEAVQAYLEPALYNIHMTESTARARAVEAAFRTAGEIQQMQPEQVVKETQDLLKPYKNGNQGDLVVGFQEYANTLAKKSNRYDRPLLDNKGTRQVVRGSQALQRIGGRGTILGNLSSVLAQPLNQVIAISDAGVANYTKGIAATVGGDKAIQNSSFIKARKSRAYAPIRTKTDKVLDAGAMPLQTVEEAAITVVWNSQHAKAKSEGLKGQAAIDKADIETERLVAGRGIADKPEAYRSVLANNLLQYTLEVNAQNKAFFKDLDTQQKATFMVAAMGMNTLMSAVTGFTPLPDFLKAALDTFGDFLDDEDERTGVEKAVGGAQRVAGEYVGMNPVASATANALLSQDQRRSLFGEDSQVGMFEGTAAPVQVVRNTVDAGRNLARGNFTEARNDALRNVPFGNQARKTITGAETLSRGYAVDSNGNPTFAAPTDPWGKAQTLAFGPSSTKTAQNYYDNRQSSIKGKDDLEAIKNSSNKAQTVNEIQQNRGVETSGEVVNTSDSYGLVQDAFRKSDGELKGLKDYSSEDIKKAVNQVNNDFKSAFEATQLPIPQGMKFDTISAQKFASYAKSVENVNELEAERKTKSFFTSTYKDTLDDISQSFYKLGDDDMRTELQKGTISKQQMDKIIQIDDILTQAGLQKYPQVGKQLRAELGYGQIASSSSKSSGSRSSGRSSSRKSKFSIPDGFSLLPQSGSASGSIANLIRNAEVIYRKS